MFSELTYFGITYVAEHIKSEKLALVIFVFANNTCFCNLAAFDKSCKTDKLAKLAAKIESVAFACNEIYIALAVLDTCEGNVYLVTSEVSAGISALENFMKTYRYSSYQCTASTMEDFRKELILQKRIEFWGEGIIYWDYKRLELPVTRGYPGTNCPVGYRMNSKEGYCCPWFNLFFSKFESINNQAIILNPDPSAIVEDWTE